LIINHCFKEEAMPARTSRREARERIFKVMTAALDRMIPPDEMTPLRGSTFGDWEEQAAEVRRAVIPTLLEERAALEENARVSDGGCCPHCSSDRVYLEKDETTAEARSPDGPIAFLKQNCRCRACGGSFSPSEP
jgi:hypothetical protein